MAATTAPAEFTRIAEKVLGGKRITFEDGVWLLQHAPIHELSALAHHVRDTKMRAAGREDVVTYVISRNINYTNVCITDCDFCSFYRRPLDTDAYTLDTEALRHKAQETLDLGGSASLSSVCRHIRLARAGNLHDAIEDAWLAMQIYLWLHGYPLHRRLRGSLPSTPSNLRRPAIGPDRTGMQSWPS